jgi:murein DD-endopeptidase MepM/ murein hydrolase activator NlpD
LLNASVGFRRVLERLGRPDRQGPEQTTAPRFRGPDVARFVRRPTVGRINVPGRLGHERALAIVVAAILLGASILSVAPGAAPSGATGGPSGDGPAPRLAIGGASDSSESGDVEAAYADDPDAIEETPGDEGSNDPAGTLASAIHIDGRDPEPAAEIAADDVDVTSIEGPFLADGTLLKPVAVDTTVADGSDLVRTYKVKAGDTLVGIAKAHGVSMMTLWWANRLKSKDSLHQGQILRIPPVTGLVVTVKAGDTLESVAKDHKVTEDEILKTNGITDPNLVVGQVLVLPGAKGDPIPTPKPTKKPTSTKSSSTRSSGGTSRPPRTYSGGTFRWPTSSHHISQYYHYGHYGIDIDGSTGNPIYAAASGTVTFAGWKSNGGGYQVWIAHGSGLYTTYNHMSSVSVGRGQHVSRGQRVGRMGASGYATGSHLHFEVWKGPIWNGGRRVNPLAYL